MIDPKNVHLYDANLKTKEEFLLFSICVAGKKANVIARKIEAFVIDIFMNGGSTTIFGTMVKPHSWFDVLKGMSLEDIEYFCRKWKLGKYKIIPKCLYELSRSDIDIENCTVEELEKFPGIGPKTSRYFVMYTQRNKEYAALDTHILRWLRDKGYKTPKSTPSNKRYLELEQCFLTECKKLNRNPADLDLEIWKEYSGNN